MKLLFSFLLCVVHYLTLANSIALNESVTQVTIELKHHKSVHHRLLEMGFKPSAIKTMFSKKPKPPKPKPDVHNDTVPLFKYMSSEFYGEILLGHPGQKFKVLFDTAWGDSFVPSINCPFINACRLHTRYDSRKSSTYKANGTKFDVDIKPGEKLTGYLSEDLLHIGHVNITNFTFAEITNLPKMFVAIKADGIFGMSLKELSNGGPPFFYYMMQQFPNIQPIFSFYLNRNPGTAKGGSVLFGDINKRHYRGNITYLKVVSNEFWQVKMDRAFFEHPTETFCASGCKAYFDTGSISISVPKDDFDAINKRIRAYKQAGSDRYEVDCSTVLELPVLTFVMNGISFPIKGKDYIQKVTIGPGDLCLTAFEQSDSNDWGLGVTFLYQYYSIYDMKNLQVGLAKVK